VNVNAIQTVARVSNVMVVTVIVSKRMTYFRRIWD